jgi:AraC-like DNA-binding protein
MARLYLPVGALPRATGAFRGKVWCIDSPLGIEFALVDAEPFEFAGKYLDQPAAIWLTVLLTGRAVLRHDRRSYDLAPGDIVYGPTFVEASLRFESDFRQLFVRINRLTFSPRVFAPLTLGLGYLPARTGVNHVFSSMLCGLAGVIEEISPQDLRPVELSLTEFLLTALDNGKSAFGLGGVAGARAAQLHRVCQNIETMLGDPALSLAKVAQTEGVSPRYLQKLFTEAGNTFSHFLRTRRLERCRADLLSPQFANLSISEICFRWGFNGSAHFSRVFRSEFGVSPRVYRRTGDGNAVREPPP